MPREVRERLIAAIDRLSEEPLTGALLKGGLRGLRRLRVGNLTYSLLSDLQFRCNCLSR